MLPPSGLRVTRPPVTGNANRTAGPFLPCSTRSLPGHTAFGTMPFCSSADATPGAVVTAVVPPCRDTPATPRAAAPCDVAADAAVTAEPVSRPVIATVAARYLSLRMSFSLRPARRSRLV